MVEPFPRRATLAAAVIALVAGLLSRKLLGGELANITGVAWWTVLVACLLLLAWPRLAPRHLFLGAATIGIAVELFQLTGVPLRLHGIHRAFALVFGTTFQPSDLPAYVLGAAFAGAMSWLARPRLT
ncbi:MAG: DUF2809 domain-containing protein [Myxococcales bacterium]|nr:DUF2809 domain-containing protein [Myxococcales bacterium]